MAQLSDPVAAEFARALNSPGFALAALKKMLPSWGAVTPASAKIVPLGMGFSSAGMRFFETTTSGVEPRRGVLRTDKHYEARDFERGGPVEAVVLATRLSERGVAPPALL